MIQQRSGKDTPSMGIDILKPKFTRSRVLSDCGTRVPCKVRNVFYQLDQYDIEKLVLLFIIAVLASYVENFFFLIFKP